MRTTYAHMSVMLTMLPRFDKPIEFRAESRVPAGDLTSRIRKALESRQTIESDARAKSHRRLAGSVEGSRVCLTVWDDRLLTRRKSWNIELRAEVEGTASGGIVHGTLDIPDRGALTALMRMFRVAAAIPAVLAIALAAQAGQVDIGPVALGASLVVGGWYVTYRMQRDGEIAAADDATLLDRALRRLIA